MEWSRKGRMSSARARLDLCHDLKRPAPCLRAAPQHANMPLSSLFKILRICLVVVSATSSDKSLLNPQMAPSRTFPEAAPPWATFLIGS